MPYIIKPVDSGYKVFNRDTGKSYSKHPQTLRNAYLQYYILEKDLRS